MEYKKITNLLDEYSNYRLYNAARLIIDKDVRPLPFVLNALINPIEQKIIEDLNPNNQEISYYVIYDYYTAKIMKELGEPINYSLLYPIWGRRYNNQDILDDLIFQKVQAHILHKIPIESLKNENI